MSGTWKPSTAHGANVDMPPGAGETRHISGRHWLFNGQQIYGVPQRPVDAILYKVFSVYYVGGVGFYVLRGDARNPPNDDVFHKLQFNRLHINNDDLSSYLTNAGQYSTLRVQPQDPRWAKMLLPTIYHNHQPAPGVGYGGLIGELPIFLALMAFTTSRELISRILPHLCVGGRWVPEHQWQMQQMDRRGLVVSVYTCPPGNVVTAQQTWAVSTEQDLQNYEMGVYGKYFY